MALGQRGVNISLRKLVLRGDKLRKTIISAEAQDNYVLRVEFSNGSLVYLNMAIKLHTARFKALADKNVWFNVMTDGNVIYWSDYASISFDEVLSLTKTLKNITTTDAP